MGWDVAAGPGPGRRAGPGGCCASRASCLSGPRGGGRASHGAGRDVPRVTCGTHVGDVTAAPVQNVSDPRGPPQGLRRARERLCPLAHMSRRYNILLPFRGRPTRGPGSDPGGGGGCGVSVNETPPPPGSDPREVRWRAVRSRLH